MRKSYDLVVLGGGITGICTAYWAARAGLAVCVVDRHGAPALETSFANGGQISASHAEPWANPGAPLKVLEWLLDAEAPLLFRPKLSLSQWIWIAGFLRNCTPARAKRNTQEIVQLATYSRQCLQRLRREESLQYRQRTEGIVHFYRNRKEFAAALPVAELMREHGCERRVITPAELNELEPAFEDAIGDIVGATYTPSDESGDARLFCQELANRCVVRGVDFSFDTEVVELASAAGHRDGGIGGVGVVAGGAYGEIRADRVVVCMGAYSAPFLRRYGVHLNIYPAKGYSVSIPIDPESRTPVKSLTDDEHKLVYSNLHTHLRVAGTAELAGYGRALNRRRCEAIVANVRKTFPRAGNFGAATFWSGLRPATPSNLPYIGPSAIAHVWLNTGHGTLGWTMGAGSGKLLVDEMTQGETEIRYAHA